MNIVRRSFLKLAGSVGALAAVGAAGLLRSAGAWAAWNKAGFESKAFADALKNLGVANPVESRDIAITAPDIAENGAVVPVSVTTTLADVTSISFLVSENPVALVASYKIPAGTLPSVANRIKMAKTSNVVVVVEAGGKLYSATKEVKVTVGGCGG